MTENVPEGVELHGAGGVILWRPPHRPLAGAWWSTTVPDPSPETSALIWRLDADLRSSDQSNPNGGAA